MALEEKPSVTTLDFIFLSSKPSGTTSDFIPLFSESSSAKDDKNFIPSLSSTPSGTTSDFIPLFSESSSAKDDKNFITSLSSKPSGTTSDYIPLFSESSSAKDDKKNLITSLSSIPSGTTSDFIPLFSESSSTKNDNNLMTLEPLRRLPIQDTQRRSAILNGSGIIIKIKNDFIAVIKFARIKVIINKGPFYINGELTERRQFFAQNFREVYFDAFLLNWKHRSGAIFGASVCWVGEKPTLQTRAMYDAKIGEEHTVQPILNKYDEGSECRQLNKGVLYVGIVKAIQPDFCVVKFGSGRVLVPASSLLVDPWTKDISIVIRDYVKYYDYVALTCRKEVKCYIAEVCGTFPYVKSRFDEVGKLNASFLSDVDTDWNVNLFEAENNLIEKLECLHIYLEENKAYQGYVVELPFRNYAVACIGVIRVLIHINKVVIVSGSKTDEDYDCIGKHLKIGSKVLIWVEHKKYKDRPYYWAREARILSESNLKNKTVLKDYNGTIKSVLSYRECSVELVCDEEMRQINAEFYFLMTEEAFNKKSRASGLMAVSKIKEKWVDGAQVKVTGSLRGDDLVLRRVWLI